MNPVPDTGGEAPRPPSLFLNRGVVMSVLAVLAVSFVVLSNLHSGGRSNLLVLTLLNLNLILVVLLALLLSRNLLKWVFEGYRLRSLRNRLVAAFLGFSLVPTVLLFVVASELLTNSVDGWFSPQVEVAMSGAVRVARDRYREMHLQVGQDAQRVAGLLAEGSIGQTGRIDAQRLEELRTAWGFTGLSLQFGDGPAPPVTAGEVRRLDPLPPEGGTHTLNVPDGELVQVQVPIADGHLVAERIIPGNEIARLRRITDDYENFAQLAAYKEPIKEGYRLSVLVIVLVILFSATWFGFYIARTITTPVQRLVAGTREVARGNLDVQLGKISKDEVGELVAAFNTMTEKLARNKQEITDSNKSLTASNLELEERRAYMEAILENADTGVIALDPAGRVTLFNRAAANILALEADRVKGRPYRAAFRDMSLSVFSQLADLVREGEGTPERELTLARGGRSLTLKVHARKVLAPGGESLGLVLVFDDLTELIQVQKEAAWREVAQRLAHEIKNPLTPIKLSVERLRKRYSKEGDELPEVVEETTTTILEEVGGLKRLVDEFSQFARMPEPHMEERPVWPLVGEAASLYRQAYPGVDLEVEECELGVVSLDSEKMRRVFTNLFENAVLAMDGKGKIRVTGQIPAPGWAEVRIADNGPGIEPDAHDKVFQPYFSRREGGTGLGLAIVSRIMEQHGGRIRLEDNEPDGTVFVLTLPTREDHPA